MLKSLQIRNYVLIDSLDVEFPEGLVIITGQTGAGKSILLGALSLLLGSKADASVIGEGADNCVVEAVFGIPDEDPSVSRILEDQDLETDAGELIIRRVVSRSGRSRAFINDSPVNLQTLQAVSSLLVDIHSQHQTLLLSDHDFQLGLLDHYAGNEDLLKECASAFRRLKALEKDYSGISGKLERMVQERDYVQSRWQRLDEAGLKEGELEELEAEQKQLANAETIKENLCGAEQMMDSLPLKEVRKMLEKAGNFLPQVAALAERVESARTELNDILSEVSLVNSRTGISQQRLEEVEGRMSKLYDLMNKYSVSSVGDLIATRDSLAETLFDSDSLQYKLEELGKEVESAKTALEGICRRLHETRAASLESFSKTVGDSVRSLELERAVFKVELEEAPVSASGSDDVRFLFSATGGTPADLSKCASGGEMSRLMLCLKAMMARFVNMPTLIFDEIDSGVSGSAADKMGRMICSMGKDMQVIAITHLPQVAAKGDAHYLVEKDFFMDKAVTSIHRLDGSERVMEIARMLSGSHVSDAAVENAKILLSDKGN